MAYALLTAGLDPAARLGLDNRLAETPPLSDPVKPAPRFGGARWGEGTDAQAGQDAALALVGLSLDDLPAVGDP